VIKNLIRKPKNTLLPAVINFAMIVILLTVTWLGLFQALSLKALDLFFKLKPNESPDNRIALVKITEDDIAQFQNYPFTESQWTEVLERILSASPAAIGFDIFRDYPFPKGDNSLNDLLKREKRIFGITALDPDHSTSIKGPPALAGSGRIGDVSIWFDPDQILRRVHLWAFPKTHPDIPNISLQLVYRYLKEKYSIEPTSDNRGNLRLGKVSIVRNPPNFGDYRTVGGGGYQLAINWRKPLANFPAFTISRVLTSDFDRSVFKGKIVLVGVGRETFSVKDVFPSPLGAVSGIEFQAQVVSSLLGAVLDGRPLTQSWTEPQEVLWFVLWSGGFGGFFWRLAARRSFVLFSSSLILGSITFLVASLVFLWGYAYLDFLWRGYWIPIVPLSIALPSLYIVNSALLYILRSRSERERYRKYILETSITPMVFQLWERFSQDTLYSLTNYKLNYKLLLNDIIFNRETLEAFKQLKSDREANDPDIKILNSLLKQTLNIYYQATELNGNINTIFFHFSFLPNFHNLIPRELSNNGLSATTRHMIHLFAETYGDRYQHLGYLYNIISYEIDPRLDQENFLPNEDYARILASLIENALLALGYRSPVPPEPFARISIDYTGEDSISISVHDNGIPFHSPTDDLPIPFASYWPATPNRIGLGLYRVTAILSSYRGSLVFHQSPRKRVEVILPIDSGKGFY
jgi:CHASE2 domain-containing sensor protein